MKKIFFLVTVVLLISTASYGQQQQAERIIRFHSDIKIETDGRVEVAEHIRVYAGREEIKRGIVREIPIYRVNNRGKRVRIDFNILSVLCNGAEAKYYTERNSGNLEVYIGDEDVLLNVGEYDYTIRYESYGHIGFFDDYDELYWNVTGTEWIFPIEQASAAITLPGNANAIQTDFYTGVKGAKGKDCRVEDRGNIQIFTTTRRLAPHENLSVAVGFPRDIIARPPPPTKAEVFWYEHTYGICGWAGAAIFLFYFFITMLTAGKPHIKPVAIPTFKPPRNLSPASIRYLTKNKFDNKAFTVTLVEMAVKGAMNIRCDAKKKYSLVNKMNTDALRPEELQMHTTVFGDGESNNSKVLEQLMKQVESNPALKESLNLDELQENIPKVETEVKVNNTNFAKFSQARIDLKESMKEQWNLKDFLHENKVQIILGGLILNAIFMLYIILTGWLEEVSWALVAASPFVALEIIYFFKTAYRFEKLGCSLYSFGLFALLLFISFVLGTKNGDVPIHWPSAVFFTALSLAYSFYAKRLRMFTAEGAALSAEIDGFKMYMKTAEEHRLNLLTPPERTPQLFEKLLPYSIALDAANEWCKKFGDVLKRFNYQPEWYNGTEDISITDFADTFSDMTTSLDRSVDSATKDPSKSDSSGSSDWDSGSSGGGSSGGGGGGGGGRGW